MKEKIKQYLRESMSDNKIELEDTTSLYDAGVLDSLKIVQLTLFLQDEFHVGINPADITLEDFETIEKIQQLVQRLSHR